MKTAYLPLNTAEEILSCTFFLSLLVLDQEFLQLSDLLPVVYFYRFIFFVIVLMRVNESTEGNSGIFSDSRKVASFGFIWHVPWVGSLPRCGWSVSKCKFATASMRYFWWFFFFLRELAAFEGSSLKKKINRYKHDPYSHLRIEIHS